MLGGGCSGGHFIILNIILIISVHNSVCVCVHEYECVGVRMSE